MLATLTLLTALALASPGDWPEPRHNPHLTAVQPTAGAMRDAPGVVAQWDLGRRHPAITPVTQASGELLGIAVVAGALYCYDTAGNSHWKSHPPGLNYELLVAARDLNGDGSIELLLQAGRSMMPYGAAVLVSLDTGDVLWRYDVEPMSYAWYLYAGKYVAGAPGEQIVVLMHGYPPDPKNGYIAMFSYADSGAAPEQRWRHDFEQYTCFPSLLRSDLDGDGAKEIVVQTHSRMWFLDAENGAVKQFLLWDVAPANVRSYGLVRFVDLDLDGREDFLCIANFAQHHEVLLNKDGRMEKAWHHGWDESVTTGKVATVYTDPPYADLDGDGRFEVVVSMFNSEDKEEWLLRGYDAVTGELKYRMPGVVAEALSDLDRDGRTEILANRTHDPTRSTLSGAVLLKATHEAAALQVLWEDATLDVRPQRADGTAVVRRGNERLALTMNTEGEVELAPWSAPPTVPEPDFSAVAPIVGPALPQLLAADLLPAPGNEIILFGGSSAQLLQLREGELKEAARYATSCLPAIADFNGDGTLDIALAEVDSARTPVVRVVSPAVEDRLLWESNLPAPERAGLPQPRTAYLRTGRFTGAATPDLYFWAGTPVARSLVLRGSDGTRVWEKGEVPNSERYWGASVNLASVYDFNGDGKDDLIFTNPDYYCIADGPSGALLLGPAFPPDIFKQPSQGLYTLPALLAGEGAEPLVALTSGHYFQGVMDLAATPRWHALPQPGAARSGSEGFLRIGTGEWLLGYGRQDGRFVCVDLATGAPYAQLDVQATVSDVVTLDVDGDGQQEFLFGTSHGELIAVAPESGNLAVRWRFSTDTGLGTPMPADLDGDAIVEIVVADTQGRLLVLR